ncbi:competence protein ComG [Bacillus sp. FJAT-27225]|uniref:competence type IV pilus assembly protein ComGB n=1 Tax=Bacillus sp. FJAT-27225 TaxID=1743144 RepID=UPI00080C35B8|nr:competence type IV pilus assembly protein ComGB [Bacillus sp. FJAT-27225]OCA91094.1 competence protein ComG [Bacillus sp. FJAT-27225]
MKSNKWPLKEQAEFLKEMGELLQRGYHMSEAIESISLHLPSKRKLELSACLQDLKNGTPFHDVIEGLGFNKDLSGYVYFAEQHGNFEQAILEGSTVLLNRDMDSRKLRSLLYYPALLLIATILLFTFVQQSLLPRFTVMFHSMGLEEHGFTAGVIRFGQLLPLFSLILAFLLTVLACLYQFWYRSLPALTQRRFLMKVPLAGQTFRLIHTHYFSIQLSYLLSGGLSFLEALTFFENHKKQDFYSEIARHIKSGLIAGESLEAILPSLPFFENGFSSTVRHGQKNGRLPEELRFYSKNCLSILEKKVKVLIKVIQPSIFLIIAVLVISIYLAILLPMFHMLSAI